MEIVKSTLQHSCKTMLQMYGNSGVLGCGEVLSWWPCSSTRSVGSRTAIRSLTFSRNQRNRGAMRVSGGRSSCRIRRNTGEEAGGEQNSLLERGYCQTLIHHAALAMSCGSLCCSVDYPTILLTLDEPATQVWLLTLKVDGGGGCDNNYVHCEIVTCASTGLAAPHPSPHSVIPVSLRKGGDLGPSQ